MPSEMGEKTEVLKQKRKRSRASKRSRRARKDLKLVQLETQEILAGVRKPSDSSFMSARWRKDPNYRALNRIPLTVNINGEIKQFTCPECIEKPNLSR